jgi:hypothetical protein
MMGVPEQANPEPLLSSYTSHWVKWHKWWARIKNQAYWYFVMEDDDVSFSMDEDLVGRGGGSTDDNGSFLSCASEELDGSESDSSGNSDESDDEDIKASINDYDSHIAKRQRT